MHDDIADSVSPQEGLNVDVNVEHIICIRIVQFNVEDKTVKYFFYIL